MFPASMQHSQPSGMGQDREDREDCGGRVCSDQSSEDGVFRGPLGPRGGTERAALWS